MPLFTKYETRHSHAEPLSTAISENQVLSLATRCQLFPSRKHSSLKEGSCTHSMCTDALFITKRILLLRLDSLMSTIPVPFVYKIHL